MYFYSILFGDVKYMYMLMLLIDSLKTHVYKPEDKHIVLISRSLSKVLENMYFFGDDRYHIIVIPDPIDIYDGMRYKYKLEEYFDCNDKQFMYIDCDMLCVRPFVPEIPDSSFILFPEGTLVNRSYSGSEEFIKVENTDAQPGFTAGFFGYKYSKSVSNTFKDILESMNSTTERFYTLDQPHFNKILYHSSIDLVLLDPSFISFNINNFINTCCFVNFCGEPGNGELHFSKMFDVYMTRYSTFVEGLNNN